MVLQSKGCLGYVVIHMEIRLLKGRRRAALLQYSSLFLSIGQKSKYFSKNCLEFSVYILLLNQFEIMNVTLLSLDMIFINIKLLAKFARDIPPNITHDNSIS